MFTEWECLFVQTIEKMQCISNFRLIHLMIYRRHLISPVCHLVHQMVCLGIYPTPSGKYRRRSFYGEDGDRMHQWWVFWIRPRPLHQTGRPLYKMSESGSRFDPNIDEESSHVLSIRPLLRNTLENFVAHVGCCNMSSICHFECGLEKPRDREKYLLKNRLGNIFQFESCLTYASKTILDLIFRLESASYPPF
jgi:hypothetical protein